MERHLANIFEICLILHSNNQNKKSIEFDNCLNLWYHRAEKQGGREKIIMFLYRKYHQVQRHKDRSPNNVLETQRVSVVSGQWLKFKGIAMKYE